LLGALLVSKKMAIPILQKKQLQPSEFILQDKRGMRKRI
jgi:hypothetical protein